MSHPRYLPIMPKLITCILPLYSALELAEKLKAQFSIDAITIHHCRGSGTAAPQGIRGLGRQLEKDVLLIKTTDDQADSVFEWIYWEAKIHEPHHGFIYQSPIEERNRS